MSAALGPMILKSSRASAENAPVMVFAAASLTDALKEADVVLRREAETGLTLSFASSSTLARQIEKGAPANIFISADEKWMDALAAKNLLARNTRVDLLANTLVLVVPGAKAQAVDLTRKEALKALLGDGRLAVGDPSNVPAGIYARQALTSLGLWDSVADQLAVAEDVRGALQLVARGEAAAGIVYATDVSAAQGVTVAATFPAKTHDPIIYPMAVLANGNTPAVQAVWNWLRGEQALAIFARYGFRGL
ncbi:molybdate ABC transporter substrate-binding protein [Granulibacter bethesdensis]|uniref:molybdate ABC transporter substrate-binding protein n=1 Tax=Granulibacter bethesdensis TaxID=364410 RepID=UPI001E3B21BE|nr:molybdate ABC transporter substrate-binding protein [Granulibacter bethesdensis]